MSETHDGATWTRRIHGMALLNVSDFVSGPHLEGCLIWCSAKSKKKHVLPLLDLPSES